jgi:hypothetical protein
VHITQVRVKLSIFFLLVNVLDILSTLYALSLGNQELNWLFRIAGGYWIYAKLYLCALVLTLNYYGFISNMALKYVNLALCLVVVSNLFWTVV